MAGLEEGMPQLTLVDLATPLGRHARPEEIARQLGFLLSDDCALMTGATLLSDGGYTL
ncbi:SDR family oxidoreductase [Pyxidicoccus xibeiensis]|uniref:SDR family oxidoreductase n=1 Tax=Pyxidicoccus xibeiensis TaxID=2906759 RepID=UPI00389AE967